jgi:hypothetical protein
MRPDDACFDGSGSVTVAVRVMTSMPKPGSMVSILSQSSRVIRLTSRRAPRPARSRASQSCAASHGLGSPDRLGEGAADLDQGLGADRLDRLGKATGRLIKTPAELGSKTQRQRCTRLRQHISHAVKAEDMKSADHVGRQAKRCD